jgi:PAS domain S-box-containing protein
MNDTSITQDEQLQATAMLELMASVGGPDVLRNLATTQIKEGEGQIPRTRGSKTDLSYRSLVEKLPVVTFMASLDETKQEVYISPQIEALLGYTQEEWIDNPFLWYRQLHPDDREMWVNEFARTCSVGKNFRAEYRLVARDGRIVWVQGECQLIRDENGRPVYLQGIAFDITHLKHAAKVEEEKLAAEAANRAKSEFLARMSHEIRTPLNGVVGMVDLLSATGVNDTQRRYLQLARQAADSLMSVINDILDFSKIEAGKVEIESVEFDLYKIIEDLTELLAPLAAKKNLSLTCLLRPEVPRRLIGDPNRLRQILTNLINNALKFTHRGFINVRASVERQEEQKLIVRIQVEDTGMGIPADRLNRLFKSFSQVDSSTTRRYGGTGLGLVISKRLAELMNGEMGVESQERHGTTFWFTVRCGAVAEQQQGLDAISEALRNGRILAIEPDPTFRRILADQLEGRLSPDSRVVGNDEALNVLEQAIQEDKPFNVALLPYGTPLNGAIRSIAGAKSPVMLALLDIDDRTERAAIVEAGFADSLHRPLMQSRLMDAITTHMIKRDEVQAAANAPSGPEPLKGLHLLVAEDNEMNQFVTQQTLARAGCTCEIVSDGLQAVQAAERGVYDAVLMDCQMPVMDGLEAARRIREKEAASSAMRIPIIALTAEALSGDKEKCLAAGMDGYVSKPINPEDLFKAIGALTSDRIRGASRVEAEAQRPVDVEELLRHCMGDATFAIRTLEKFSRRALEDVDLLRDGIKGADIEGATRLALNLKGAAAHVSASPLGKLAFEIESAGLARDMDCLEQCVLRLDEEAKRCRDFLPEAVRKITQMGQVKREKKTDMT